MAILDISCRRGRHDKKMILAGPGRRAGAGPCDLDRGYRGPRSSLSSLSYLPLRLPLTRSARPPQLHLPPLLNCTRLLGKSTVAAANRTALSFLILRNHCSFSRSAGCA